MSRVLVAAGLVIIVFGMQAAQSILVPLLLAAFIAILAIRPMLALQRLGIPHLIAVLLVALGLVVIALLVFLSVGASINEFSSQLPFYQARLDAALRATFSGLGEGRFPTSIDEVLATIEPGGAMRLTASLLSSLGSLFTNAFLILFTVVFVLLEAAAFRAKLRLVSDRSDATVETFARFANGLQRYLALKTLISLATGALVTIWVTVLGLDFPLLWGLLAFLLNYIPTIGSIIAAVPAVLLGFIQFGLGRAAIIATGYLAINLVIGNLVEPRVMGRGLGLSTLVVFLALVFWGWVFGPVGMLLSVPLTMTAKIALEADDRTRWLAVLLGDPTRAGPIPPEGLDLTD